MTLNCNVALQDIEKLVAVSKNGEISEKDFNSVGELRNLSPDELEELYDVVSQKFTIVSDPGTTEDESDLADGSLDSVTMYFKEIAGFPLLTREQEKEYFTRYREGEKDLRELLITSNLKLVVPVAKQYLNNGVPLNDLIQEGNCGLMTAVDKFDVSKGFKFSTYARWWIVRYVRTCIAEAGRTIRIPLNVGILLNKIKYAERMLTQEFNRQPTEEELSNKTGIPEEKIRLIKQSTLQPLSLDTPLSDEEGACTIADFIPYDGEEPDQEANLYIYNQDMSALLSLLTEKEYEVLKYRLGLEGETPHTLKEIGNLVGLSNERVRQIGAKAIRKLGRSSLAKRLKDSY